MQIINIGIFQAPVLTDEFKQAARASVESRGQTIVWESDSTGHLNVGTVDDSEWGLHKQVFSSGPAYILAFTRDLTSP
jgi:hypothetical protein